MQNKSVPLIRPAAARRDAVALNAASIVAMRPLDETNPLPLLIEAKAPQIDCLYWGEKNREFIRSKLLVHGGLLFRGFGLRTAEDLHNFARVVSGNLLEYRERSSPRSQVRDQIYTSTDYPADQEIFFHNENSYQHAWPMNIYFFCETTPQTGGTTPIADCRRVFKRLSPSTRETFAKKQCMYVRNFGENFGLPWPEVFQTTDRATVEQYCRENDIQPEWLPGNGLRTRTVRPALEPHPILREPLWFNHVTFFHVSTLAPSVRDMLLEGGEANLPTNTYYGDGGQIPAEVLNELREAYRAEAVSFPWQRGDVMLLDNMLVAHARASFQGARKILVAMAQPVTRKQLR